MRYKDSWVGKVAVTPIAPFEHRSVGCCCGLKQENVCVRAVHKPCLDFLALYYPPSCIVLYIAFSLSQEEPGLIAVRLPGRISISVHDG